MQILQLVRGPTADFTGTGAYLGNPGELAVEITASGPWNLRLMDGVTPGGFVLRPAAAGPSVWDGGAAVWDGGAAVWD
jgi:hypothetical protein